jgi:hypothetical protein
MKDLQFNEIQPAIMFCVNPVSTQGVSFVAKTINAIYEATVAELELEIFEIQNDVHRKAYNSDKNFWKLFKHKMFLLLKTSVMKNKSRVSST